MADSSLQHVADRLRRNETGYSVLELQMNPGYEARDVDLLTEALLANHTLEAVDFFGILGEDDVNAAVRRLFESFGTLGKLKSLQVAGYCEGVVQALAGVIDRASQLETVSIKYVQLNGTHDDFDNFNRSLREHTVLKEFHVVDCQLPENLRDSEVLHKLLESLSRLPTLSDVSLSPIAPSSLGSIPTQALLSICQMQGLTKLHIYGFRVPKDCPHLQQITHALEENRNIRDLHITSTVTKENCTAVANLLYATTSLMDLRVDLVDQRMGDEGQYVTKYAEALQGNSSLKHLIIRCLACPNGFDKKTLVKFGSLLENNFSVQSVEFVLSTGLMQPVPIISFYTNLNIHGRGELIQGERARRQDWVDKIVQVQEDLDSIYYFLSTNPSLCESNS